MQDVYIFNVNFEHPINRKFIFVIHDELSKCNYNFRDILYRYNKDILA